MVGDAVSAELQIKCGVPQGSILGPLLFILYMNDLKQILNFCRVSLYADDTVIWTTGMNVEEIQVKLQQDLINVTNWLRLNKLSVNASKCKTMIVSSPNHSIRNEVLHLHIDNEELENVASYKYLGIHLDCTLSFVPHVDNLVKKVGKRLGVISMARKYMGPKQCNILYKTLVLPVIDYGDIIYMEAPKVTLESIQVLQNRACRIILQMPSLTPTDMMHQELKLMKLMGRRVYHLNLFTFKALHNLAPGYIINKLGIRAVEGETRTRSVERNDLVVPRYRLERTKGAFSIKCPIAYNLLPVGIRESTTTKNFRVSYFDTYEYL